MIKPIKRLMDYILPAICLLCGQNAFSTLHLCTKCQNDLPILSHHCRKCAQFLPFSHELCGGCLASSPLFNRIIPLFPYEPPIVQLVIALKFRHDLSIAKLFGQLFIPYLQKIYTLSSLPDLLVPIPLHPERQKQRGFNQTVEIAKPIAHHFKIPIDRNLFRLKKTLPQSGLSAPERQENLHKAFHTERNYAGLHLAVLDDVVTTTSTVSECCRVLKQQGARQIDVWCIARRG